MTWATMTPMAKMGILFGLFVAVLLIALGFYTKWHFKCYQRLPATGQDWPK